MIGHVRKLTQHKRGLPTTTPVVVHCSAGIGRTGTFILVDLAMNALERSRSVDLLEVLDMMRQQRMGQVGASPRVASSSSGAGRRLYTKRGFLADYRPHRE